MNDSTLRLVIFSFVLSILFPIFGYTFTTFGSNTGGYDATLSVAQLQNAGVLLSDYEPHNVTFGGAAQEYTVKNSTMRVKWIDSTNPNVDDYFANQQQSAIELLLGTWIWTVEMDIKFEDEGGFFGGLDATNDTIVNKFNSEFNWTKYSIQENSLEVFITTLQSDNNNMSKAIYETGTVTVTVASQVMQLNNNNFLNFGNWYFEIVTGSSDWGLPAFMVWIVRIFSFMTLLAGTLLVKEFIPFVN